MTKERLSTFAKQVARNDEEYSHDGKFVGGRGADERVPQRYLCIKCLHGSGRKDLELERRNASFDPREMNYYIHGGKNIVEVY